MAPGMSDIIKLEANQELRMSLTGLFLLFLGLKLGGAISWSWWWVTAPIWGPVLGVVACWFLVGLGGFFMARAHGKSGELN